MIRRGMKKDWGSQATVNFADDPELLTLARRSGCKTILIGIESEKAQDLKEVNKAFNIRRSIDQYNQVFKTIHKHGIAITGTFIFGFDNDDAAAISERVKFINKSQIDTIQATIMTPLPGTRLFQKILEEGRMRFTNFPEAWQYFTFFYLLQNHAKFTPKEFEKIMYRSWSSIYAPWRTLLRAFLTIIRTRSFVNAAWTYKGNVTYRRIVMETFEQFHQKS
jgi:radical SAM superfamily enzyme YgiQ (UPF0313 family)